MPICSTSRRMRTIRRGPRSGLCKLCWRKIVRGEKMNRVSAFRVVGTAIALFFGVSRMQGQQPPKPPPAAEAEEDEDENPFAPESAPMLPAEIAEDDGNDHRG